ncbi:MAG: helix-turn-helix transcriptional regulator [Alphaproteobacteria bacterium]|nr:helix-turn-helix transcriptional regulator [Alphaproteobacteria bacterium]
MISIHQLRAARALINWSQRDLANKTGISLRALANIESGASVPRISTADFLEQALEKGGVEFLSADGVRLRKEVLEIHTYEGNEALRILWTDMFEVLPNGDEYMGVYLDERFFAEKGTPEQINDFYKKCSEKNLRERLLIKKGDDFIISARENYRWLRSDLFIEIPFIIYGNTVIKILMGETMKIILIRNEALANAYKKQFEIYWHKESEKLPKI